MSVQRAAAWVLDKYYTEFPIYNPYLDRVTSSRHRKGVKMYEIDGQNGGINVSCFIIESVTNQWCNAFLIRFYVASLLPISRKGCAFINYHADKKCHPKMEYCIILQKKHDSVAESVLNLF